MRVRGIAPDMHKRAFIQPLESALLSALLIGTVLTPGAARATSSLSPLELTQLKYSLKARDALLGIAGDSKPVELSQKESDYWVVTFVSSRCPCSAAHEARLKELAERYKASKFSFLGVHSNADETQDEARAHFEKARFPFPVLSDRHGQWAHALGALKTPHAYIIDARSGSIVYQGGVDDSTHPDRASRFYLAEALEDLAAGKAPRLSQTRALGCQIKRN